MKIETFDNREKIGELIHSYNNLELLINKIIMDYYEPNKNREHFYNLLLNGTIVSMGQKIKILANLGDFSSNKTLDKLRRIMNIRNGVVHNNPYLETGIIQDFKNRKNDRFFLNSIDVMNSSGKIKTLNFDDEYKKFNTFLDEVIPELHKLNLEIHNSRT